jgi:hypothetical protein
MLRATPPYKPKGCTRAGQNTSRVLVAIAMSCQTVPSTGERERFFPLALSRHVLSPSKGGVLRATPPHTPKGCTRAGQYTSRVLVAIAMLDSS